MGALTQGFYKASMRRLVGIEMLCKASMGKWVFRILGTWKPKRVLGYSKPSNHTAEMAAIT